MEQKTKDFEDTLYDAIKNSISENINLNNYIHNNEGKLEFDRTKLEDYIQDTTNDVIYRITLEFEEDFYYEIVNY